MTPPCHAMAQAEAPAPAVAEAMRPSGKPTFVGREAELGQLMRMLGAARHGDAQLAWIEGPAGIGKTRLCQELVTQSRRRGARAAIGQCWQDGDAPPLWPWLAVLRDLGAPEDLLEERVDKASGGRVARFLAVRDYVRLTPRTSPLVVVLDDVHLADLATLLLARFLARERHGAALLLLLTRREGEQGLSAEREELLVELCRDATTIHLSALSDVAVGAYLSAAGRGLADPELLRVVAAVTRGNPLHLRSLSVQSEIRPGGLQAGLGHAISGLLERLAPADRRLIGLAALLAPEVSVHEVARIAEVTAAVAAESLAQARQLGLMAELEGGRLSFVHELVRESAVSALTMTDRLDAHARAARVLGGHHPEQMLRRAHHALAAANRSTEDAAAAVTIARDTARALHAMEGFESAATLFGRAVEIHDAAGLENPAAELMVERAESVLACGRLAEARVLFQHAARVAERERDPVVLARAALGLGGVWIVEHRLPDEVERVRALQRRALEGLPGDAAVLRARLRVRLAAEEAYRGGGGDAVLDEVEAARRTGDAQALAEALSLCHHTLLTPEHTWRRLALANELIAAAADAADGLLLLVGLCWRAVDLFLLGDPVAGSALEELRLRADAVRCRSVLFIVRAMEVMLAVRAGRLGQAEQEAAACFELGSEVGDADALAYRTAHLCAIRHFQGREAELADLAADLAGSPTLIEERERAFAAAAALFALRAGRPEPGVALLERLRRSGLGSIPASSSWLLTMLAVVELASALGDRGNAQAAYDALLPYAELPIMGSLAVVCFGSVQRGLGLAAQTCGRLDLAVRHFEGAVAAGERLGHRPATVQAKAELALAHLRRAGRDDVPRGRTLLQQAIAAGEAMGMTGLVTRWRSAAAGEPARRDVAEAARMALVAAGRWRVVHDGQIATVPDRVGMRYLASLVAAPDRAIPALALVVRGAEVDAAGADDPLMDQRAIAELRERIRQLRLRSELSADEQDELETLTRELASASGLGGRQRSFADAPERARTAVTKAIKRAIHEIEVANPVVGRHLAAQVETGAVCRYRVQGGR